MQHENEPNAATPAMPAPVIEKRIYRVEIAPITIVATLCIATGAWVLIRLLPVVLVLITALMIVGTLTTAVERLEARKMRRGTAIAIIFSALLLLLFLLVTLTLPALVSQVSNLIDQEPKIRAQLANFLAGNVMTAPFADGLRHFQYDDLIKSSKAEMLALSRSLFEIIAYGAGAFFLALYIMIDRDRLRGALFAAVPRSHHMRLSRILLNLQTIVGGYVRGQVITCVLIGIFLFLLLTACGIPNAVAFAVFGAIVDVLPFIGAFLTMAPVVLAALAKGPVITMIVLVLLLCYEEFESRVLIPVIYGRTLRLPSSIVLFALIAGATLGGIVGALLALPVAAAMLMLIEELRVELPGESNHIDNLEIKVKDAIGEAEYERRTDGLSAEESAPVAMDISDSRKQEENK